MKKIFFISALFVLTISGRTFAQTTTTGSIEGTVVDATGATGKVQYQDFHFTTKLTEGANSHTVPGGTLQFTKRGDSFSNIVFLDSLGNRNVLIATRPGTNGAPKPECKSKLSDACFGTASKNVGLCICKPTDLTYIMEFTRASKLGKSSRVVIRID